MPLKLITAPTAEPVALAEQKLHMRVDLADDDAKINALLLAARQRLEHETWRAFMPQTWEFYLDAFPTEGEFELPLAPLASVTFLKYTDQNGALQTLVADTDYIVDAVSDPGRISLGYQASWPSTRSVPNAVVAKFVAGYASAAAVPGSLKLAIQMLAAHWYENREPINLGNSGSELPMTVADLISPYRVRRFAQ
jgi:uncharacterized phiE125 gp8 family phage protein